MSEGFQSYCLRWGELSFKMGEGILGSYGQDRRRALPLQTDRRCSSAAVIPATFRCSFFSRGRYFSRWHFDCQRLACGGLIIHAEKLTNWALHSKGSLSLQAVHTLGDFSCHRRDNPLGEFFFFLFRTVQDFHVTVALAGRQQPMRTLCISPVHLKKIALHFFCCFFVEEQTLKQDCQRAVGACQRRTASNSSFTLQNLAAADKWTCVRPG